MLDNISDRRSSRQVNPVTRKLSLSLETSWNKNLCCEILLFLLNFCVLFGSVFKSLFFYHHGQRHKKVKSEKLNNHPVYVKTKQTVRPAQTINLFWAHDTSVLYKIRFIVSRIVVDSNFDRIRSWSKIKSKSNISFLHFVSAFFSILYAFLSRN